MSNSGSNRREEYYKLAVMFSKCRDINEAHRLSASVFGIEKPLHLKGIAGRKTESINSGVFEETPHIVTVMPRVRTYREKAKRLSLIHIYSLFCVRLVIYASGQICGRILYSENMEVCF